MWKMDKWIKICHLLPDIRWKSPGNLSFICDSNMFKLLRRLFGRMEIAMYFVIFYLFSKHNLQQSYGLTFILKMYNIFFIARLHLLYVMHICASFTFNRVHCTFYHSLCPFLASSSSLSASMRNANIMLMEFHLYCRWIGLSWKRR